MSALAQVRTLKHPTELALAKVLTEIENLGENPVFDKVVWLTGISRMKLAEYFDAHPELLKESTG